MNQLQLHIDEAKKEFLIKGDVEILLKDRRVKYYLFNTLEATQDANNAIVIKYNERDRNNIIAELQEALEKYNIKITESIAVKDVLQDYFIEKEKFKAFTEKARQIWNNNVDVADFKNFKDSIEVYLPHRRLYDKQLLSAFHLAFAQNACNFSVPGAGKTSIVYAAYTYLNHLPKDDPKYINKLLIIGPLSSFRPWEDEYEACFGKASNAKRLSGGIMPKERQRHLLSVEAIDDIPELTLMSYQSISHNIEELNHFLQRADMRAMIVLDEAHKIKNIEKGVVANAVLSLSKLSGVSAPVVLTGTPVPNGYEDIYNLYQFIWPGREIINFTSAQLKEMSSNKYDTRIDQLISSILPFFIRIRKKDILPQDKFPIIDHHPIYVKMDKVQREVYDFLENRYMSYFEEYQDASGATSKLIKARFMRLMQASTNVDLLRQSLDKYYEDEGLPNDINIDDSAILAQIMSYRETEVPPKFKAAKNLIEKLIEKDEKVIVWATFVQNMKELQIYLRKSGIESELLYGGVPTDSDEIPDNVFTREKIISEFHKEDSAFKVIIANPFAVSESISLHKACHHAIYIERTFNAANFIQSKDRIHRVGLPEGIVTNYYYILSENSIDDTIQDRLEAKVTRMLELVEGQEIPLLSENLDFDIDTQEDLKSMIRDYVRRTAHI